jgi:P pilus assembly chaperone PapD
MKNKLFSFTIIFIVCCSFQTFSQGDLLINPHRVIFKATQVKEIIDLMNTGEETTTYVVSFVQRRMNENGSFSIITIPDAGQNFSDSHLRIYPRRITLIPGEGQAVMLQRKRNRSLPEGEYRSHLYFRAEKKSVPLANRDDQSEDAGAVGVSITPVFGTTIPIIIRSGTLKVVSTLSDLKIVNSKEPKITFTANRIGNISTFGDFDVEYIPLKGKPYSIGVQRGVSIYTTIEKRFISINLITTKSNFNFKEGSIKVSYTSREGSKDTIIYSTAELFLGS